jgi:hypothetical protein
MIKSHGIDELQFQFFTPQAIEWYDPLKPYTLLEYQWVRDNIKLNRQTVVVDAGCHHGNYAVVFKPALVIAIDSDATFLSYAVKNMELNNVQYLDIHKKLGASGLDVFYAPVVDVYKMDIEGDEFDLLPGELERFNDVKTWIIEIHPKRGDPNIIASYFKEYSLLKVDRELMQVRPYVLGETWKSHSTLIAQKT